MHKKESANSTKMVAKIKAAPADSDYDYSQYRPFDTTITPFSDKNYQVKLYGIDRKANQTGDNLLLTLGYRNGDTVKQLFRDSLFSTNPGVLLADMNNDKVPDIMIYYGMSIGNSNVMYHLYLCDTTKHRLIRVKGFEDIYNPELISEHNIIESFVSGAIHYYTFHRINSRNRLIDLGHSFDVSINVADGDKWDRKYKKAIKQIVKEPRD